MTNSSTPAKRDLVCPCGEHLHGDTEDLLFEKVQAHLETNHPGRSYTRAQILSMAS
jgi:hypothetical protein